MSLKTKLTSLITTFVLLCSLLTVGVFAVKNTTFNVGGDIVFNVQGIEATITRGATAGFTADKTIGDGEGNILSNITLNNDMSAQDVADEFAPWSGLNLAFSENVATIKLTITNTAEEGADNYLDITALASATTQNNARVSVVNDAGGITALLQPQQSASFTITFSVIDDEYSASLEGFSVNFDMQKKVKSDFPSYDAVEGLTFSCDTDNKTATLTDGTSASGNVEIPAYVKSGDVVCAVTCIEDNAFFGAGITDISIPNSVTSIEESAFSSCESLRRITIPDSVTSIKDSAFAYCGLLESIKISDNVTNIPSGMCMYTGLLSIKIPDNVTSIGATAFGSCESLENIILPNGLVFIGYAAFDTCCSLTSITIPTSVTKIQEVAFRDCTSLTTVNYRGTQEQWNAINIDNTDEGNQDLLNANVNYNYKG